MANQEHLDILKQGVETWNQWRKDHWMDIKPDLSSANLRNGRLYDIELTRANLSRANLHKAELSRAFLTWADLSKADLSEAFLQDAKLAYADLNGADLRGAKFYNAFLQGAKLHKADLRGATFWDADLRGADLSDADLSDANLFNANLYQANLQGANLYRADLSSADLGRANLSRADLSETMLLRTTLVETNLTEAILTGCRVNGISVWKVNLQGAKQDNIIITDFLEPTITVDNLNVAQFLYLLLNNKEIRDVIDTITSKVVLILGRFTKERKVILDAIRDDLRKHNYLPVLFDFDKPASRDITETVSTLAHLSRFVIADITDARSIPQELMVIVPHLPSVPVQPLILTSQHEYGMFEHFTRYPWVLPVYRYTYEASLLQSLNEQVIAPAEKKAQELQKL
jgi:uncharacterized protein YjbI with pentapeptide repeats